MLLEKKKKIISFSFASLPCVGVFTSSSYSWAVRVRLLVISHHNFFVFFPQNSIKYGFFVRCAQQTNEPAKEWNEYIKRHSLEHCRSHWLFCTTRKYTRTCDIAILHTYKCIWDAHENVECLTLQNSGIWGKRPQQQHQQCAQPKAFIKTLTLGEFNAMISISNFQWSNT